MRSGRDLVSRLGNRDFRHRLDMEHLLMSAFPKLPDHFYRKPTTDAEILRERFIADAAEELLNGGHVYLYNASGRISATYTADTILDEECLYQVGDAAILMADPLAFGLKLQQRMKNAITKWVDDHLDEMAEGDDQ